MQNEYVVKYKLSIFQVFILRLYTTAAYWVINSNMRKRVEIDEDATQMICETEGRSKDKYPFPATMTVIKEAIMKLRGVHINKGEDRPIDLFRGMADMEVPEQFLNDGGCEFAPCSTTTDIVV